jgi:hypothetical protein
MAECKEHYPDIFKPIPPGETPGGPTDKQNQESKILYLAVRHLLRRLFNFDRDGSTTVKPEEFPEGFGKRHAGASPRPAREEEEKVLVASAMGYLRAHGYDDPSLGKFRSVAAPENRLRSVMLFDPQLRVGELAFTEADGNGQQELRERIGANDVVVSPDPTNPNHEDSGGETFLIVDRFITAFTDAVKYYFANRALHHAVFRVLQDEGKEMAADGTVASMTLNTRQFAEVTSRLVDDRVPPGHPQLRRFVINALSQTLGGGVPGSSSDFDIDLPDLDAGTAVEIVRNNVRAVAAIYFSAMLEEMRLHAVMEKIGEHFTIGMVPISRGTASDRVYKWIKGAPDRFSEIERRGVYGRVLGLAQGAAADLVPNREFTDLWIRFLSTVSVLDRERRSSDMLRVSQEQALKAGRDLAVNISLHGYGIAHPAAIEMQGLVREIKDVLSEPALHTAYGVNDIWQLVDRVNVMYLGGYVNGVRYRTMARAGAEIILWLADHSTKLASVSPAGGLDFGDARLVNNVERWLAVTGTPDASVEQYTDPVDLQAQPTIPAFAPTNGHPLNGGAPALRETLETVGVGGLPSIPQI